MPSQTTAAARRVNTPGQALFASLIGTTIEFFDFYIYATAAVLVFPRLFFPASDPASATLASLATCRFGQGLGLGGEWGGAVLLAIENAPPGRRAWYGMFPQLGAPLGFFFSGSVFLALSRWLTNDQFFRFGWRIPFLASAALVVVGLYVRLTITETPVFRHALTREERVKVPMVVVFRDHLGTLI